MAIELIDWLVTATISTGTITIPSHQPGDLIVVQKRFNTNALSPAPSPWVQLGAALRQTMAYQFATSSSTELEAWDSISGNYLIFVYRGVGAIGASYVSERVSQAFRFVAVSGLTPNAESTVLRTAWKNVNSTVNLPTEGTVNVIADNNFPGNFYLDAVEHVNNMSTDLAEVFTPISVLSLYNAWVELLPGDGPAPTPGIIKAYNGTEFVSGKVKGWNGSEWVDPKAWNGSEWV